MVRARQAIVAAVAIEGCSLAAVYYFFAHYPSEDQTADLVVRVVEETLLTQDFGGRTVVLDRDDLASLPPLVSQRLLETLRSRWPDLVVMDLHYSDKELPGVWTGSADVAPGRINTTHVMVLFHFAAPGRRCDFGWTFRAGPDFTGGKGVSARFRYGRWTGVVPGDAIEVRRAD